MDKKRIRFEKEVNVTLSPQVSHKHQDKITHRTRYKTRHPALGDKEVPGDRPDPA